MSVTISSVVQLPIRHFVFEIVKVKYGDLPSEILNWGWKGEFTDYGDDIKYADWRRCYCWLKYRDVSSDPKSPTDKVIYASIYRSVFGLYDKGKAELDNTPSAFDTTLSLADLSYYMLKERFPTLTSSYCQEDKCFFNKALTNVAGEERIVWDSCNLGCETPVVSQKILVSIGNAISGAYSEYKQKQTLSETTKVSDGMPLEEPMEDDDKKKGNFVTHKIDN